MQTSNPPSLHHCVRLALRRCQDKHRTRPAHTVVPPERWKYGRHRLVVRNGTTDVLALVRLARMGVRPGRVRLELLNLELVVRTQYSDPGSSGGALQTWELTAPGRTFARGSRHRRRQSGDCRTSASGCAVSSSDPL